MFELAQQALSNLVNHAFLQNAMIGGVLAGVACGLIGPFVVMRRIGYMAGGISHGVLGGMGAAFLLGVAPLYGAILSAVAMALLIGWVNLRWRAHEDTLISAVWATGMALGIIFMHQSPGYRVDLMSYLFGNILFVGRSDLLMMAGVDLVLLTVLLGYQKYLVAISFDEAFARQRSIPVTFLSLLLLVLVALTVVILIQIVGLILVIALLTLPAAAAGRYSRSVGSMMVIATVLTILCVQGGLVVSYATDWPSGPTIVLATAGVFVLSLLAPRGTAIIRQKPHAEEGGST
ncbi:MAG: metal ABC transporter permease [Pseudomonadota bacterium]|nr:metal ABC transporter permease [Pseudomonadota bacterium]